MVFGRCDGKPLIKRGFGFCLFYSSLLSQFNYNLKTVQTFSRQILNLKLFNAALRKTVKYPYFASKLTKLGVASPRPRYGPISNREPAIFRYFGCIFPAFCYFMAQGIDIFSKFSKLRPRDQFGLATPGLSLQKSPYFGLKYDDLAKI